jgi:hypothetical protein
MHTRGTVGDGVSRVVISYQTHWDLQDGRNEGVGLRRQSKIRTACRAKRCKRHTLRLSCSWAEVRALVHESEQHQLCGARRAPAPSKSPNSIRSAWVRPWSRTVRTTRGAASALAAPGPGEDT